RARAGLDQAERQCRQRDQAQRLSGDVERVVVSRPADADVAHGERCARDADRDVDDEHGAPADRVGQQPADDRPAGGADAGDRAPGSSQTARIGASEAGTAGAAPRPGPSRAPTRAGALGASPQASDAAVNSAIPIRKTRRAPWRSASVPPVNSSAAKTSV